MFTSALYIVWTVCFLFVYVFSAVYPRKEIALLKLIEEPRWVPLTLILLTWRKW